MISSVHLECSSRTPSPRSRQVIDADQVRMSVKLSHSPTSLGTYRRVYPQKHFLFGCVMSCWRSLTRRRFADRFGRKTSFYLAWLWLVIVSDASGEEGAGPVSRNKLMSLGLRSPQHGQDAGCMGESKPFPIYRIAVLFVLMLSLLQALAKLCNGAGIGVLQ
jgi:hypothetical protein